MGWRRRAAAVATCLLLFPHCTSRYTLRTVPAQVALQWPFQPRKPKVTFVGSWTGLSRSRGFGSAVRSFVYGRDTEEGNAFVLPVAVATGADGRIAVADMGRRCVHLYVPEEKRYLRLVGSDRDRIVSPVGVAFDDASTLYASDSTGKLFVFGKDGTCRRVLRDAGPERLLRPTGLAFSPRTGLVYVVDTLANRVHAYTRDGTLAFSFGRRGEEPGAFNFPTHIFRSVTGELYVTDALNFRIAIFDESGKPLGSFGHHGDGSGDLAMPKGLAVDRDGVVYVVDSVFDNVQLFDRGGAFLLTVGGRGGQPGEFWLPSGVFIDDQGQLLVCDTYNRRIQVFRITGDYAEPKS